MAVAGNVPSVRSPHSILGDDYGIGPSNSVSAYGISAHIQCMANAGPCTLSDNASSRHIGKDSTVTQISSRTGKQPDAKGTSVKVTGNRYCQMCEAHEQYGVIAMYDAKTVYGSWALLCEDCFKAYTTGRLGIGIGQRLEYQ